MFVTIIQKLALSELFREEEIRKLVGKITIVAQEMEMTPMECAAACLHCVDCYMAMEVEAKMKEAFYARKDPDMQWENMPKVLIKHTPRELQS